ncbi:MAG: endonuclease/exonuclease/phosphatase family protein [Winogradskyella sp.]|nr:endonuclease/exonuclease/phosphatase family protein [Winogradskyella sp.]
MSATLLIIFFSDKKVKIILSLISVSLIFIYFKNYYFSNNSSERNIKEKTIVFWNVNKQEGFNINELKEVSENQNIETILLVEAIHEKSNYKYKIEKELNGFKIAYLNSNMIVASKNKIETLNYIEIKQDLNLNHILIGDENYLVVDIYASPLHNKKNALNKVIDYANKNNVDVILGDFNTPYESIYFEKFTSKYTSLRTHQNGFTATWPFGIPLLELDQIWIKNDLVPISLKKLNYLSSDHAVLVGKFKLQP